MSDGLQRVAAADGQIVLRGRAYRTTPLIVGTLGEIEARLGSQRASAVIEQVP
jgi:hypothetical protein